MRSLLIIPVLAFFLVACETTELAVTPKKDITITRGMPMSEVVSLIGEPDFIESGVDVGSVKMDKWHYEIIVSQTSEYQEIDTSIEPDSPQFNVVKRAQTADPEFFESVLVEITKTQIMDVLVYDNRVFTVQGELKVNIEREDWRDR